MNWKNEYPRPQLRRENFISLNGTWQLNGHEIEIPFPPESKLSGYNGEITDDLEYSRSFTTPDFKDNQRVILHFGAVDQVCEVFVNGKSVTTHEGGYLPFSADITDFLYSCENEIKVRAFDSLDHLPDLLDMAEERSFIQDSITLEGILTLHRCVMLFVAIFRLVNIVLCAAVVFIFVSFSTKMIHDKLHEIGILKALGTDRLTINIIFGLQIALIAIFTCVVSTLGYRFLIEPANELFILSLREMVPSQLVLDLDVLVYSPRVVWENVLLVAILSVVSLLVPMTKIGRIQPVKIINTRD